MFTRAHQRRHIGVSAPEATAVPAGIRRR